MSLRKTRHAVDFELGKGLPACRAIECTLDFLSTPKKSRGSRYK